MIDLFVIYILNLLVVVGMFIVTVYRAYIEYKNLQYIHKIKRLRTVLKLEREALKELSSEELKDFIEYLDKYFDD